MSSKHKTFDLLIIGGGVMGTFHAYHALRSGLSVALLEKNQFPKGATVRNFGQLVPSGLNSQWQALGRQSLRLYKQLQEQVDITFRQEGSVYLASNEEEMILLEELSHINREQGYASRLLSQTECLRLYRRLKRTYCEGGLYFPGEGTLDPRQAIYRILIYLAEQLKLQYYPNALVIEAEEKKEGCVVRSADGRQWQAAQVILCNGSDFQALFPKAFRASDLQVVKIQMLQTVTQTAHHMPGAVLTGRTIRRYESFRECPSYPEVKAREKSDLYQRFGIHLLFKQAADGSVIIGDSHEYASVAEEDQLGFDINQEINRLILEEAWKIFSLRRKKIRQLWTGRYCQHPEGVFQHSLGSRMLVVTGIGGKGMTVSPGFAAKSLMDLGMISGSAVEQV